MRGARLAVGLGQAWLAAGTGYLLTLTAFAAVPRRPEPAGGPGGEPLRFVVLVPAHDEEEQIAATVAALLGQTHPSERREVLVIADNCTDATADRARAAGATVWARDQPDARGKGQALAWAMQRLWRERPHTDAVAIVDADCHASPGLLAGFDRLMRGGATAVQAVYDVANPEASTASALRWAGFALMHRVRPSGRARLGLSADLFGTGMAFRADLLRAHPWTSFSITEDAEYHLRLVEAGERVAFLPDERVESAMPTSHAQATEQQLRWESGNAELLRRTVPRLLREGLRRRDAERIHAALEQLVPPQTVLVAANGGLLAAAAALRDRRGVRLGAATLAAQGVYVLAGLRVAQAPPAVFRALLQAPRLLSAKLPLFARIGAGRGASTWVRTDRQAGDEDGGPASETHE
jgi:hypothetical protein